MEVKGVRSKADTLKQDITDLITKFMSETDCRPEISLNYDQYNQMGERPRYIPYVDVEVKVV